MATQNAINFPVLDEDNMASNSATSICTQQSIKAYVDASSGGSGLVFAEETGTSANFVAGQGIIANNAGLVTLTLPATAAVGDRFAVAGLGAGGWAVAQNASQLIRFGSSTTTTGAGGSLASTSVNDALEILCTATNNEFVVRSSVGSITVV